MPIWFDAMGLLIGSGLMAFGTVERSTRLLVFGVLIFGLACFAIGGRMP